MFSSPFVDKDQTYFIRHADKCFCYRSDYCEIYGHEVYGHEN